MPVLKSAAPVLLSGSVAGVTSYGCYSHISNASLDGSVGTGQSHVDVSAAPEQEESNLEPNAADTGDSVEGINKAEGSDAQTADTKEEVGASTEPKQTSSEVTEEKKDQECRWYSLCFYKNWR